MKQMCWALSTKRRFQGVACEGVGLLATSLWLIPCFYRISIFVQCSPFKVRIRPATDTKVPWACFKALLQRFDNAYTTFLPYTLAYKCSDILCHIKMPKTEHWGDAFHTTTFQYPQLPLSHRRLKRLEGHIYTASVSDPLYYFAYFSSSFFFILAFIWPLTLYLLHHLVLTPYICDNRGIKGIASQGTLSLQKIDFH